MARGLEWDAGAYGEASTPQRGWGRALLASRRWRGDEAVLDAGCGPGQLSEEILRLVPHGRLVAVDVDPGMVKAARERLAKHGGRARVLEQDLARLSGVGPVDVVFSNAVFHWVPDHDALFEALHAALRPGGELLAQCGGAGNIDRVIRVADRLIRQPPFAPRFAGWTPPWHFEDVEPTSRRLRAAGFVGIDVSLREAPVRFDDAEGFRRFVCTAPLLPYLSTLAEPRLQDEFLESFVRAYGEAGHGWELDYVRLTLRARRPAP